MSPTAAKRPAAKKLRRPELIISGGQTGADRGGLDAAIALGIPHGGYMPAGRKSEDGSIPRQYVLWDCDPCGVPLRLDYAGRTRLNVATADATILFVKSVAKMGAGSILTVNFARQARRAILIVELDIVAASPKTAVRNIRRWLKLVRPSTLNVAGSRESTCPGIEARTKDLLLEALEP
jgi:hypothetical protein